jgi:PAS domain S-box-containing protein
MVSERPAVGKLRNRERLVLVAILIGLVAPLLGSTWYSYRIQSEVREHLHWAEAERLVTLLVSGMRDPVRNLNPGSGQALFESTLKNQSVVAIRVTSVVEGDFLVDGNEAVTENVSLSKLARDIFFEDEKIGEVSVVFDNSVGLQESKSLWLEILFTLAVQISVSAILVYLLLRAFANLERNRVTRAMHDRLEGNERNYRSLFENATAGIGRTELESGKPLLANARLAKIFGYDSVTDFTSNFIFADHYPAWDNRSRRLEFEERHQGETIEALFTKRDGSLVFTEGEVRIDREQGIVDFVIIDVSERHRAKTALKEIEHNYQALFESANVGIGRTRVEDAKLLIANQKLAEMFGYDNAQDCVAEYDFMDNYPDRESRADLIARLDNTPGQVVEEAFKKRDGSMITVLACGRLNREAGWIDFVVIDITDLKLANKARREYEDLINALINHSPIPISVKDLDGKYIFVSPAFTRYLGTSTDNVVGKEARDFLQPEVMAVIQEADDLVTKTGKPMEVNHAFPVQIGSSTLQINKFPIIDELGKVNGVGTIGLDITEAVRTERELSERTEKLEQAERIANLGHWKWSEDGSHLTYCSEQAARIFGMTVSELLATLTSQEALIEFVVEEDREYVGKALTSFTRALEEHPEVEQNLDIEYRIRRADGSIRHLRDILRCALEDKSGVTDMMGTIQDITELALARDELQQHRDKLELLVEQRTMKLKESEERFRSFYEINPDVFMITDLENGNCVSVNDGFTRVTGYSREEVTGKSSLDLNLWKNNRDRKKLVAGLRKHGYVNNLSAEFRRKDGSFWPGMMAACSVQLDGRPHILSSTKDVSEMRDIQDAALKANNAKSEFLSSMSHELRTPLNAVMGFAQILRSDSKEPLSQRQLESIDIIINGGNLLLELINQVLELSKIEAGKLDLTIEPVMPGIVIEECLTIAQSMATPRSIEVINESVDKELPNIQVDLIRLKQVLLNLLSNAVKYNRDGGSVTVDAEPMPNRMLRVSVTDTGPGLTTKEQKRVFEPFDRLGKEATEIQGTGIGLAISKNLVKTLGGTIGIKSRTGQGSTFWIELPMSEIAGNESNEREQFQQQPDLNQPLGVGTLRRRVLYIEDNPMNAQLMQTILEGMPDIELIIATNAEKGIDLVMKDAPDVILMDISLPGMDGIGATRVLKKSSKTSAIPIIAISAGAMPDDIDKAIKAGIYEYVTKPINIARFLQVLGRAIEGDAEKHVSVVPIRKNRSR